MPEHWQETTLGEVVHLQRRRIDPSKLARSKDLLHWSIPALDETGGPVREAASTIGSHKFELAESCVLLSLLNPRIPRFAVAQGGDGVVCSTEFAALTPTDEISLPFLACLVSAPSFFKPFLNLAQGTTKSRERVKPSDLLALSLRVPTALEQRRIVDLVGSIDTYINSLETQIETTRTARIALATALLDSLDGTPTKSLAEIEDEGLVELGRGKVISKKTMSSNPGDFPVYSSAAQNDGMIGSYNEYMFDEELITWSVDGGGHLFHRRRHKFSVTNIGGYLRILDPTKLRYGYLCAVLQGLHSRCHFDWQHKAHPSVIRYEYSKIPIPEMAQQQEIEQTIEAIDEQISSLESQVESVRSFRSGVLSELLSGERLLDDSYDVAVGL